MQPQQQAPVAQGVPVAAVQQLSEDALKDVRTTHACYQCTCCPPTLQSMAIGLLVLEILGIIGIFIAIAIGVPGAVIFIWEHIMGTVIASIVICRCKCCPPDKELLAWIIILSILTAVSAIKVVLSIVAMDAISAVVNLILVGFRAGCIHVGVKTKEQILLAAATPAV